MSAANCVDVLLVLGRRPSMRHKVGKEFEMSFVSRLVLVSSSLALLSVAACSDPVLPPSEGAFAFSFQQPSGCSISNHNPTFGEISYDDVNHFEIDGLDGAEIYCQVSGEGNYYVDAFISGKGRQISIEIKSLSESNEKTSPAEGTVTYNSLETTKTYSSPSEEKCIFYLSHAKQQVTKGALFITFECPSLDNLETNPHSECATGVGWIGLQNCDRE
jgi:hypothetical protein